MHLQTSYVDSKLAVINDPSSIGSNFDFENFGWDKTSDVVENIHESSFGEGQANARIIPDLQVESTSPDALNLNETYELQRPTLSES
jgi:hypothetical protein